MWDIESLREPIVQAPMAGGPSTPALTVSVSQAGALGFLAGGYVSVDVMREQIQAVRSATSEPFGLNIFVPSPEPADPQTLLAYLHELEPEAQAQGVELGEPRFEDDGWEAKLALASAERVPVVSFTFGCPSAEVIDHLHDADISVWVTVTSADEATYAQAAGADGLVLQGIEAGGHRSQWIEDEGDGYGLLALIGLVRREVKLPLIASGGIGDGAALAGVLCAGASAAQIGTALMLSDEAGTSHAHREVLAEHATTRLTRAFTGRLARGLVNRFMQEHGARAPIAYPEIHHATAPLRAAARERGDYDSFNLWAGQTHELARARPAGEIIAEMSDRARAILRERVEQFER